MPPCRKTTLKEDSNQVQAKSLTVREHMKARLQAIDWDLWSLICDFYSVASTDKFLLGALPRTKIAICH